MAAPLSYDDLVRDALTRVATVDPADLLVAREKARRQNKRVNLLDIRELDEVDDGVIAGATHLPRGLVELHAPDHFEVDDPVYVICERGNRSALVADVLQRMGYAQVFNVRGGMAAWTAKKLPIESASTNRTVPRAGKMTWAEIRAEFPISRRRVPVMGGAETSLVYMDHGASTHPPARVLERHSAFMGAEYANIHRGTHVLSRRATERFDDCYTVVSDFIGGDLERDCVVFLMNTTQSIDLAAHVMSHVPGKVVVTELEHHSNDLPHRQKGPVLRCRIDDNGELDMKHLARLLADNPVKLVAVSGGSNVTGYVPDLHRIAEMAHEVGARILVDAAQLLAHAPIDVRPSDDPGHLDFVAAAGHKAYAPFGASFLYGPRALMDSAPPYLPGGGTASRVTKMDAEYVRAPDRHQGGTPNIGGVIAMAEALRFLGDVGMERVREHELALVTRALDGLTAIEGVTVYGPRDPAKRLGVISFNVDGVSDQLGAAVLSEEHAVACRNGRFCAHVHVDRLIASQGGASPEPGQPGGCIRASVGLFNNESDIDRLIAGVQMLRARNWRGRYQIKRDGVSAEFLGRCNDSWMEPAAPSVAPQQHAPEPESFIFEQLNPAGPCKCYLVADKTSGKALLVDPRRDFVDHYIEVLASRGLTLAWTVETHTHADHISGSSRLKDLTHCSMAMHFASTAPCVDRHLAEGDTIALGELEIAVWATPGHTEDSLCLLLPDRVLTGDTILLGASGRTDLGGDAHAQFASLQRFRDLPPEMQVWPAHDYKGRSSATIADQLEHNPRLQIRDEAAFCELMDQLNLPPPQKLAEALAANRGCL